MRCAACDVMLTDVEVTLKNKVTGEYFDMCGNCLEAYKEALVELEDDSGIVYGASWGAEVQT